MNEERREFIKKTSFGFLAGIGVTSGFFLNFLMEKTDTSLWADKSIAGTIRWGMLIDMRKCIEGCQKCVDACRLAHNVTADTVVRLLPPLIMTTAEADEVLGILLPLIKTFLTA